jgi:hypothetical protein
MLKKAVQKKDLVRGAIEKREKRIKIPPQIGNFTLFFIDRISKTVYHSVKFADATL